MTALPPKASRPKFQNLAQGIVWDWAYILSGAIPVPGKAAIPPKPLVPAKGKVPAVPAVPGVAAVPPVAGAPAHVNSFTYQKDATNTTLGFRLPLNTAGSGIIGGVRSAALLQEIDPIVTATVTPPNWYIAGDYAIPDEPVWCTSAEQFLGWLADKHAGTTMILNTAAQVLDFKVVLSNADLGDINLIAGNVAAPPVPPTLSKVIKYAGTNAVQAITLGLQPDLVLLKARDTTAGNEQRFQLFDSLSGATKSLDLNYQQIKTKADSLTAFTSTGITLGADATDSQVNKSGVNYLAYGFAKTPGFLDIVQYTGDGSTANRQIAHSLGVAPDLILIVGTSQPAIQIAYCAGFDDAHPENYSFYLQASQVSDDRLFSTPNIWGNTLPTQNAFTVLNSVPTGNALYGNNPNQGGVSYIAYLFASKTGASKIGGYTGDGMANVTINCGFAPSLVIAHDGQYQNDWHLWSKIVTPAQPNSQPLQLLANNPEWNGDPNQRGVVQNYALTFTDAGFSTPVLNATGKRYIYMAFA